jgi:pyruvate/2-oxoacid:ferredoxin oxidoreductase beta subunit
MRQTPSSPIAAPNMAAAAASHRAHFLARCSLIEQKESSNAVAKGNLGER